MRLTLLSLLAVAPLLAPAAPPEPLKIVDAKRTVPQMVQDAAARHGVRSELALKVAWRESRFLPDVVNPESGASGVMQLRPKFFPNVAVFDPEQNIEAGVSYLGKLIERYGEKTGLCLYGHRRETCLP